MCFWFSMLSVVEFSGSCVRVLSGLFIFLLGDFGELGFFFNYACVCCCNCALLVYLPISFVEC